MVVRRLRRESGREPAPRGAGAPARSIGAWAEPAAYWLLYIVAFGAAVLHWRTGNGGLALLCAVAVAVSVRDIARHHRRPL